jgi:SAM-dependent methyltransferase
LDAKDVRERREELVQRVGPWTAHCIHLADDVYTFEEPQMDSRLRRFLQIAADVVDKPLDTLRVLDLGCLEAHFAMEFALHGSKVVAIEGRDVNLTKAEFVKDMLSLDNLDLVLDDVRNLSLERYGTFDVILCLGILYHLDAPDVMEFVQRVFQTCNRLTIIDTHVSLSGTTSFTWNGNTYWGSRDTEHRDDATPEQQLAALWNSIGNRRSFLFTRPSLCKLLRHVGFTSVYECLNPYEYHNPDWPRRARSERHVIWNNRFTLVAIKGRQQPLLSSPVTEASPEIDRPEIPEFIDSVVCPGVDVALVKSP